jgi:hypothetical protein
MMSPTPEPKLYKKFEYFYGPYNFVANTRKYLTFDDYENENNMRVRKVDYELNQPRRSASESAWHKIHEFIFQSDNRTNLFVLN